MSLKIIVSLQPQKNYITPLVTIGNNQCDQMMKKVALIFFNIAQKVVKSFLHQSWVIWNNPKIYREYLGYFCKKICY